MRTPSRLDVAALGALALGSLAGGCVSATTEDQSGAVEQQPVASYYYVFRDGILREANDGVGPCNSMGGCRIWDDAQIEVDGLGFAPAESLALKTEARAGQVVMFGKVKLADFFAGDPAHPHPVDGPVPGSIAVEEVWRAPRAIQSGATYYWVLRPDPGQPQGGTPSTLPTAEPYLAMPLNGGEGFNFNVLKGVPRTHRADAWNRGGLLVQGDVMNVSTASNTAGTALEDTLDVHTYYRRWLPAAQYECDKSCGGFNSCISCQPGAWSCTDACLGHECPAGSCGIPPAIPDQVCEDGTIAGARCEQQPNDGCGWTLYSCGDAVPYDSE